MFKGSTQKGLKHLIFTMLTHKGPKYAIYVISSPKILNIPSIWYLPQKGPKYAIYIGTTQKGPNYIINIVEVAKICHINGAFPEIAKIFHIYCSYPKRPKICDVLSLPPNCQNIPFIWQISHKGQKSQLHVTYPKRENICHL